MHINTTGDEARAAHAGWTETEPAHGDMSAASAAPGAVAELLERRVLLAVSNPGGPVLLFESFADPAFRGWIKDVEGTGTVSQALAPAAPARVGGESGKFTLPARSKRTELYVYPPEPRGAERWYASSVFVPADWRADPIRDVVMQWHEVPDWDLGEEIGRASCRKECRGRGAPE